MSRQVQGPPEWRKDRWTTQEEEETQAQAADVQTLQRAKALLCELWKQGRISKHLYYLGTVNFSAALLAVEDPSRTFVESRDGIQAAQDQWAREQERSHVSF